MNTVEAYAHARYAGHGTLGHDLCTWLRACFGCADFQTRDFWGRIYQRHGDGV